MNQIRNPRNHSRFYWMLALLLSVIFVRYAFQIDIPRILFLIIIALIALMGDQDEIMGMLLCCIPLHESIDFFYSIVICIAVYVIKYFKRIRINISFLPVVVMVLWELLHCFGDEFAPMEFISNFLPLFALVIVMSTDASDYDYAFLVRTLSVATAAVCITLLGKEIFLADFNFAVAIANLQRLGMEAEDTKQTLTISGAINPNTLGIMCVLATTGLMQLRTAGRGKKSDMFIAIVLLVFGTLTSSRTFLACLALMFVFLLFSQRGTVAQKFRFLGTIVLVVIIALVVLNAVFPELMAYYTSRFQENDLTTGRTDLMGNYHEFIVSNPKVMFFGIGLQDFGTKVVNVYRVASNVPHNGIQELVIAWGMPGLILFAVLLMSMIYQSRHYARQQKVLNYIPLIILLVKAQAGQMLNSAYTMLAFSYAYLSMAHDFNIGGAEKES